MIKKIVKRLEKIAIKKIVKRFLKNVIKKMIEKYCAKKDCEKTS